MRRMPRALLTKDYPPFMAGDIVSYGRANDGEDFYLDNGEVRVYGVKAKDLTAIWELKGKIFIPAKTSDSEKE